MASESFDEVVSLDAEECYECLAPIPSGETHALIDGESYCRTCHAKVPLALGLTAEQPGVH